MTVTDGVMSAVSGLLGGLGLLGIVVAACIGVLTLLLLPWWAIFDCAFSRRMRGEKIAVILILVITWGLGSIIYGAFITRSRVLRWTTFLTVGVGLAVLVPSIVALLTGASISSRELAARQQQEQQAIAEAFTPGTIAPDQVADFHALHLVPAQSGPASVAVARFTGATLDVSSARDTDARLRHLAADEAHSRYWGVTMHDVGTIDSATGRFTPLALPPALEVSWPKGVTFDATTTEVVVMTSHVSTRFYRLDPATDAWRRLPAEARDLPVIGLAMMGDVLYAVEYEARDLALRRLQRFNRERVSVGPIDLHPAIPVPQVAEFGLQLQAAGTDLVVLMPGGLFVVDPNTGAVRVPSAQR